MTTLTRLADDGNDRSLSFEVSVYRERGWWIVVSTDTGARVRASTLASVEDHARDMISHATRTPWDRIELVIYVVLTTPTFARVRWSS